MKKISTTKLAQYFGINVKDLFSKLYDAKYIQNNKDNEIILTELGQSIGGEYKEYMGKQYIAWPENLELKLENNSLANETLNSTAIGKHFNLSSQKINSILSELGWINKALKGWNITNAGKSIGGVEKEHPKSGAPYVVWDKTILENKSFLKTIEEQHGTSSTSETTNDTTTSNFREKFEANFRSTDGHYVRSKAEMLIDNWLYMAEIVHAYERKLPIEEDVYCDFYLPAGKVYIEYWGYENDPKYLKRKEIKKAVYEKYNFKLIELNDDDVLNLDDILPRKLLKFDIQSY